jgi:hypothetical protein
MSSEDKPTPPYDSSSAVKSTDIPSLARQFSQELPETRTPPAEIETFGNEVFESTCVDHLLDKHGFFECLERNTCFNDNFIMITWSEKQSESEMFPHIYGKFTMNNDSDMPVTGHISFHPFISRGNESHIKLDGYDGYISFMFYKNHFGIVTMAINSYIPFTDLHISYNLHFIIQCINGIIYYNYDIMKINNFIPLSYDDNQELNLKKRKYLKYLAEIETINRYIDYVDSHTKTDNQAKFTKRFELSTLRKNLERDIATTLGMSPFEFARFLEILPRVTTA